MGPVEARPAFQRAREHGRSHRDTGLCGALVIRGLDQLNVRIPAAWPGRRPPGGYFISFTSAVDSTTGAYDTRVTSFCLRAGGDRNCPALRGFAFVHGTLPGVSAPMRRTGSSPCSSRGESGAHRQLHPQPAGRVRRESVRGVEPGGTMGKELRLERRG